MRKMTILRAALPVMMRRQNQEQCPCHPEYARKPGY